jgi:hypothetical protein
VLLEYEKGMHDPTGGLLTTFLLKSCSEEPGRAMDEYARLMAGIKTVTRPWVILSPGAVQTFGTGVSRKHTPKEVQAGGSVTSDVQDCTGDVFRFVYANCAPDSLVLTSSGGALASGVDLQPRSPEYLIDNRIRSRFIYGCPFGKKAFRSTSVLTSNGVGCPEAAKRAIAACGGGVGPLFLAADVDAEKPERQVFADPAKTTTLSWYTNSSGGTTGTHIDSVHTKRSDQGVGLRRELAAVGILPMEMRVDGSTVDGLDSLNATIGYGPVSDY